MLFLLEKPCGNATLALYNSHIRDFSVNCFILVDYLLQGKKAMWFIL